MRGFVRLIAVLLGLVCAAVGVLLAVEVAWAALGPGERFLLVDWPGAQDRLSALTWHGSIVRGAAVVVAVVGLLLVLVGLRARHRDIRLHDPAPGVTVTTPPRSLARLVGHRTREQDGVASATVTATRTRVRVRVQSEFVEVGDLEERLAEVADQSLRTLPLPHTPSVSVSVRPAKE